jgi:two-component system, OmpR family, sensor histidine kinase ChvG
MASSTRSITTPASATAGFPATSPPAVVGEPPVAKPRRRRRYRSLAAKAAILGIIFLAVPAIVYDQFHAADEAQKALLLRSVREQGRVMQQALQPLLSTSERPPLPQLGREIARLAGDVTNVKLLYAPTGQSDFYYIASWPVVPQAQLEAEHDRLEQQGILDRLSATCEGELPIALRYAAASGKEEIVTSLTPMKTPTGCWALVTSFSSEVLPGSNLGRPYWASPEVRVAAGIYLAMVLLTFTTIWTIRRGLARFAERARAIRERHPGGGSFSAQNDVPELADVAAEFDDMVEVLDASARDLRRAAEDNAHAFKTPIAVIRQSLEPLKRSIEAGNQRGLRAIGLIESSLDKLDGLVASARRLDEATADLMDTPRADVDLSGLLARMLQAHADVLAQRRLVLKGHIQPKVIIYANEEMVESVVENLFDNAVSFSPDGENIGIRLEARDGLAELMIGDSGPGVAPDLLSRIFDRYFSNRTEADGAADAQPHFGIGLWIAKRNVEALGGTIQAENRRPSGLLMRVTLPLADIARLPAPAAKQRG